MGTADAIAVEVLIAFVPRFLMAFHGLGLALDRPPAFTDPHPTIAVTVLIAARNEEPTIGDTLDYLATQD